MSAQKARNIDPKALSEIFKALSDETRLKILVMLDVRPRSVNEIVDFFTLTQPTISRHLFVLRQAGLVDVRRDGQKKVYSLNRAVLKDQCAEYFSQFIHNSRSRNGD